MVDVKMFVEFTITCVKLIEARLQTGAKESVGQEVLAGGQGFIGDSRLPGTKGSV